MKSTGIRRKVDDLGRVVIPAGIRRSLGIREGDQVEVHVDGDHVILAKPVDRCVFCQADEDLQAYREKVVCRSCVASVSVLDENLRRQRNQPLGQPRHVQAVPDDTRPSQPLPPWTDSGRQRPPLQPADRPAPVEAVPAPDPETTPTPSDGPSTPSDEPAAPPQPAARDTSAATDDAPRPRDRRFGDPPASTAW